MFNPSACMHNKAIHLGLERCSNTSKRLCMHEGSYGAGSMHIYSLYPCMLACMQVDLFCMRACMHACMLACTSLLHACGCLLHACMHVDVLTAFFASSLFKWTPFFL